MEPDNNNTNATGNVEDAPQQVDLDPGMAVEKIDGWIDSGVRLLPNIIVACIVLAIFYGIAVLLNHLIQRQLSSRNRDNLGSVLGSFSKWATLLTGMLVAATIIVPSLKPGDLIAGLGVSSVAIGFAFKDILQNWLAGLLILLRQPFEINDQIKVNDFEGTVLRIETRATLIKTYDNQCVVIPNSEIYTGSVLVKTAYDLRRCEYDVGIGYGDDIEQARDTLKNAATKVDGVEKDPGVEVLVWDLAASWVTIRVRWWTDVRRASIVQVRSKVLTALKQALDEARIDMPYDTKVLLLHDQTEDIDGDRTKQREGWPADRDAQASRPRWKAKLDLEQSVSLE